VKIFDLLSSASLLAGAQWRAARASGLVDESELWRYLREHFTFVHQLGQAYRFEDYVQQLPSAVPPHVSAALEMREDATARQALTLALRHLEQSSDTDQARQALVLINLLNFVADTGQAADFEDFFTHRLDYAPLAMACFATREEAETWLRELENPPSPVHVIIGDEYFLAWYSREDGSRNITRDFVIEPYIEELTARGLPPDAPSFQTHAEAENWLAGHPASPFAFLSIAGERYFAAHHKRLKRHTLHPVALSLKQWEEHKAAEHQAAQEETSES